MKNILLILISLFLMTNCNNQKTDVKTNGQNKNTLSKDSSIEKVEQIFNNPFRDINNFEIKVGNHFIDSLLNVNIKSKNSEITLTKNVCIGDNCESYKTIIDKENRIIIYFFKGDAGEYGFSNDQYYFKNDSLYFVRNFNVNIDKWPTENTETIWRVEELTYKFQSKIISCNKKSFLTKDLEGFDFTLKNGNYEIINCDLNATYKNKVEELERHLKRKDSEDLD